MILLDTNVLSALMQREPDPRVITWLDRLPSESIWTTAITVFEVRLGLELLPAGRRRHALETAFEQMLAEDLEGRIAAFDPPAAQQAARLAAAGHRVGRPLEIRDMQIAGIAAARRATLATRNIRHFAGFELDLVDPWAVRT